MSQELTQEYLKECLDYNPDTGIFTWQVRPISHFKSNSRMNATNKRLANNEAGCLCLDYIHIALLGRIHKAHRLAWLYVYGIIPNTHIDHINGIKSDNCILNLREADFSQNAQNIRLPQKNNSSGFLGVDFNQQYKKWQSRICINGKRVHLGYYDHAHEAHNAYLLAKNELHPYSML